MNMVVLIGRLTRDCELRYTNSGTAVCKLSLAVNRRKRSGDNWEDEVSFFDVVIWGKQGEAISRYLEKGKQISVGGELRQSRWEQDGQTRSRIEVVANNVQLLGGGSGPGQASQMSGNSQPGGYQNKSGGNQGQQQRPQKNDFSYSGPEQFDDDIPF